MSVADIFRSPILIARWKRPSGSVPVGIAAVKVEVKGQNVHGRLTKETEGPTAGVSVNDGAFVALGQLAHPSSGTTATGTAYAVKYNTKYNWTTDRPGTYTLLVKYTLSAP